MRIRCLCLAFLMSAVPIAVSNAQTLTRDSAGTALVETRLGGVEPRATFVLSTRPTVVVAAGDTEAAHQARRPTSAVRLADGRIAVFDGATLTIKMYDKDGRFNSSIGGRGTLPGQFSGSGVLLEWGRDGGMMFLEGRVGRVSFFDNGLHLHHVSQFKWAASATARPMGRLTDGSILVELYQPASGVKGSVVRDTITYARFTDQGAFVDSLVTVLGSEMYMTGPVESRGLPFGRAGCRSSCRRGRLLLRGWLVL